jgi:hypothetical protein
MRDATMIVVLQAKLKRLNLAIIVTAGLCARTLPSAKLVAFKLPFEVRISRFCRMERLAMRSAKKPEAEIGSATYDCGSAPPGEFPSCSPSDAAIFKTLDEARDSWTIVE